jgi:3-hydroxymyristoyl/3-hydroxydecanoyl-(acyl carrier protein) dehydratase
MTEPKLKPTVLAEEATDDGLVLTLQVDEDIIYFQGHFATYPLLPGVTQIDWAYHYGTTRLKIPTIFQGMEVIKFFKPISPGSTLELRLNWNENTQKLNFTFQSSEGKHSSGRILLAEEA